MSRDEYKIKYVGVEQMNGKNVLAIHGNASSAIIELFKMILKALTEDPYDADDFIGKGVAAVAEKHQKEVEPVVSVGQAVDTFIGMCEECLAVLAGFDLLDRKALEDKGIVEKGDKWLQAGQFLQDLAEHPVCEGDI